VQPQVEGQITKIFVHSGDHVSEGSPILQIDPLKQQATVNNLEATRQAKLATLRLAERELRRREELAKAGVISKQDLDQAQTAYDSANADMEATGAGVREQQVQLHYYTVKAGGDGTVGDIPVRVGDRVTTQTVLTTLDLGGELEAYVYVPAEKSRDARAGTPVELIGNDGKVLLRSLVTFVSPRVDPTSQLLLIKAPITNKDHAFRNEEVVHARVIWHESERPTIPVTAIARVSGETFAYVAESNGGQTVAKQRTVKLGEIMGNEYVVLDGIKPGDKLITTGVQNLADGVPVKPQA
jgi:RND family efflux transporter MFP subunit